MDDSTSIYQVLSFSVPYKRNANKDRPSGPYDALAFSYFPLV